MMDELIYDPDEMSLQECRIFAQKLQQDIVGLKIENNRLKAHCEAGHCGQCSCQLQDTDTECENCKEIKRLQSENARLQKELDWFTKPADEL